MGSREARRLAPLCAIGLVLALAAVQAFAPSPETSPPYPHEWHFGTTGPMVCAIVLVCAWGMRTRYRCSDGMVRRLLGLQTLMLSLWCVVALVKYTARSDVVIAVCWYAFYVPMTFSPLAMALMALRTTGLGRQAWARPVSLALLAAATTLALGVLTNDIHHLAFRFDPSDPLWDVRYGYGPLYWAVCAWNVGMAGAYLGLSLYHCRRDLRRSVAFLLALLLPVITYALLYALRVDLAFNTNFSLAYIAFALAFLEAGLDLGLLPTRPRAESLLRLLPLDVRVISLDAREELVSDCARPLPREVRDELLQAVSPCGGGRDQRGNPTPARSTAVPGRTYEALRVSGGVAVIAHDTSELDRLRGLLARRNATLRQRNAALERSQDVGARLYQVEAEHELADDVEDSLVGTMGIIRRILEDLSGTGTAELLEQRRRSLLLVRLLVGYCKRKGALVLLDGGEEDFDRERLSLVVNESVADLRAAGVDCAALVEVEEALPARVVDTLYDCIYDFMTATFGHEGPTLMISLRGTGGGGAELRMALESDGDEGLWDMSLRKELEELLARRGASCELEGGAGWLRLVARVGERDVSGTGCDRTEPNGGEGR